MPDERGTQKIPIPTPTPGKDREEEAPLTGEEIAKIADLFADVPPEDDEDTGEFEPVKDEEKPD